MKDSIQKYQEFDHKKILGEGHFGKVSLCWPQECPSLHQAVKSIPKAKIKGDVEMVELEIEALRTLDHPNILKFQETQEDDKQQHIVMEVCEGGEVLDQIIEDGSLAEKVVKKFMHQIFAAMNHCHKQNICHRDLKPENFLLSKKGLDADIKIVDFGLCYKMDGRAESEIVGTPQQIAPEVLRGTYSEKCDIWSLGVSLYVFLSGYPPFPGKNNPEIFDNIKHRDFHFNQKEWTSVSPQAKDLIKHLLIKDPSKRISLEEALNHPWFATGIEDDTLEANIDPEVIARLQNYHNQNRLRKEVQMQMTKLLRDEDIENLKKTFLAIDKDISGTIDYNELLSALKGQGYNEEDDIVKSIMSSVDQRGNGQINYTEFIAATIDNKSMHQEWILFSSFSFFDTDNSGQITAANIKEALKRLGKSATDEDVQAMMIEATGNAKVDKISYEEFKKMME